MIPRLFFVSACVAVCLEAAPPLTTIQDVLYKADGTRFNGSLTISWTSFEAIDRSAIAQQTTTVTVVNGNLQVRLVPSTTATPAAYYAVAYQSDGHIQFQETWAVPSSVQSLRVRDVRIASAGAVSADTGVPATPPQESDIPGLISDLGARPLKGPAYSSGRVAWVNPSGSVDTVTGAPTDCVRVDGSSGPCGGVQPNFVDNDSPAGLVDGANLAFTLTGVPNPVGSLALYRNGVLQKSGQDFSVAGNQISFLSPRAATWRYPVGQLSSHWRRRHHAATLSEPAGSVQRTRRRHQFEHPRKCWRLQYSRRIPGGRGPGGNPLRPGASGLRGRLQLRGSLGRDHHPLAQRVGHRCASDWARRCGAGRAGRAVEPPIVGDIARLRRRSRQSGGRFHRGHPRGFSSDDGPSRETVTLKNFTVVRLP